MSAPSRSDAVRRWHDQLGAMIDQVGQPDYSLREMVDGMRQIRDEMLLSESAAKAYADKNPLGGPAVVFEAMAERIRAGEDYYTVLADYSLAHVPNGGTATVPERWHVGEPPKDGLSYLGFFAGRGGYVADQRFVPIHWSGWGGGTWDNTTSGHHIADTPTHWARLAAPSLDGN